MRPPAPPELIPDIPRRRPWLGVVSSVLIHGTLLTLVLWKEARPDFLLRPQADSVEIAARQARAVGMIFIPPPAPSNVDGRSRVRRPDPAPVEEPTPPPPTPAPDQVPTKGDQGAASEEDNVPADGGATASATAPEAIAAPTPTSDPPRRRNPSIAFRGGTPGSSIGRPDPSPAWQQPPSLASMTPRCRPGPPRSASDPIEWGVVAGRVFRLGTTDPLVGAVLQVLGTPYITVSDDKGDYVLRFDSWPLKNCEAQHVRVQLDGFVAQTLVLGIGAPNRSDVQLRGRN
jgi:hypothetical protein